jgi:hypothetical protein
MQRILCAIHAREQFGRIELQVGSDRRGRNSADQRSNLAGYFRD